MSYFSNFPGLNLINQSVLQKPSEQESLSFQLQQGIKEGNAECVTRLINQELSLTQMLPNRELPLHVAVREGNQEIVILLLNNGADPELRDEQNLSAIDHAVLNRDDKMLAVILGYKLEKSVEEVQEQIRSKPWSNRLAQLQSRLQSLLRVDGEQLSPICKAAYEGNIDTLKGISKAEANELDHKGLTPLHYAILGENERSLETLIQVGADVQQKTSHGESLLHFAATTGSVSAIETLIDLGVDPNQKNAEGETALHFAAARESLSVIAALIKGKADPHHKDDNGISALALIGSSAYERDPLRVTGPQMTMTAFSCLFWLTHLASSNGLISSEVAGGVLFSSSIFITLLEPVNLIQHFNDKDMGAFIGFLGGAGSLFVQCLSSSGSVLHSLNTGLQIMRIGLVGYSAFDALKACWRNAGYRTRDIAKNVIVHTINTLDAAHRLQHIVNSYFENSKRFFAAKKVLAECREKVEHFNPITSRDKLVKSLFEKHYTDINNYDDVLLQGDRGFDAAFSARPIKRESEIISFSEFNKEDMSKCDQQFPKHLGVALKWRLKNVDN